MARVQRLHIHGGIYYVQLRVNGEAPLFPHPDDQRVFESLLARALNRFGAKLYAYVWLRTSANLLIQVGTDPLGRIMQSVAGPFAKVVNQRLGQKGNRFQHPHGAILVQPSDLLEVVGRLHRMGIESQREAGGAEGSRSSHSAYLGERINSWLTREAVQELLQARGLTGRTGYRKFTKEFDTKYLLVHAASDPEALPRSGPEAPFMRWLLEHNQGPRASLPELVNKVASRMGIHPNELRTLSRRRYLSFARAVVAWYAMHERIATLTEVARYFGRDPSTISTGVARYEKEQPDFFLHTFDDFLRGAAPKVASRKAR